MLSGFNSEVNVGSLGFSFPFLSPASSKPTIGLGEGYRYVPEEGVVQKDTLFSSRTCDEPETLTALSVGLEKKLIDKGDFTTLFQKFPSSTLLLTGDYTADMKKATAGWSAGDKKILDGLLKYCGTRSQEVEGRRFYPGLALEKLVVDGQMKAFDSRGNTLLKNLERLQQLCEGDERFGKAVYDRVLVHAAFAEDTFFQVGGKGTCGATTLGFVGWEANPSEMVRVTTSAVFDKSDTMANGQTMTRPLQPYDPSITSHLVDQVSQASLMANADQKYGYDLVNDQFRAADGETRERGLREGEQLTLIQALTGQKWEAQKLTVDQLAEAQKESKVPLPLSMKWNTPGGDHSFHMVALKSISDTHVEMRDPAGDGGLDLPDSSLVKLGHGHVRMDRKEFEERMVHALVPIAPGGPAALARTLTGSILQLFRQPKAA